uniref:Uncharacterized protein n=1 Tax=Panagrolaimus sp. JU765 TaxID=591449 RepID=A0AC34R700_9BILA
MTTDPDANSESNQQLTSFVDDVKTDNTLIIILAVSGVAAVVLIIVLIVVIVKCCGKKRKVREMLVTLRSVNERGDGPESMPPRDFVQSTPSSNAENPPLKTTKSESQVPTSSQMSTLASSQQASLRKIYVFVTFFLEHSNPILFCQLIFLIVQKTFD